MPQNAPQPRRKWEVVMGKRTDPSAEDRQEAGARVEGLRERYNYSQDELGRRAQKVGRATIQRLESGDPSIRLGTLVKVADVLMVPPEEIDPRRRNQWKLKSLNELWDHAQSRQKDLAGRETSSAAGKTPPQLQGAQTAETEESRSSTGAAIATVADKLIALIDRGEIESIPDLNSRSQALAKETRARMIPFCHFSRMGDDCPFSSWRSDEDTINYIKGFREYTHRANVRVGECLAKHFADFLNRGHLSISITEYSRAIFSGLARVADQREQVDIVYVARPGKALVPEESPAALHRLTGLGFRKITQLRASDWQSFLERLRDGEKKLDFILFGAEAVTPDGSVVFPQLLSTHELELLGYIATNASSRAKVVCVAEAYKFLEACALKDVDDLIKAADTKYSLLKSSLWSYFVTDHGVLRGTNGSFDTEALRQNVTRECHKVLEATAASDRMVPSPRIDVDRLGATAGSPEADGRESRASFASLDVHSHPKAAQRVSADGARAVTSFFSSRTVGQRRGTSRRNASIVSPPRPTPRAGSGSDGSAWRWNTVTRSCQISCSPWSDLTDNATSMFQ